MNHYKDSNANIITQELQQLKKKKENNCAYPASKHKQARLIQAGHEQLQVNLSKEDQNKTS